MNQSVKLRLSKNDQVIGELDVTAIPPKKPKNLTILNFIGAIFFLSIAAFFLYIVIYLITH